MRRRSICRPVLVDPEVRQIRLVVQPMHQATKCVLGIEALVEGDWLVVGGVENAIGIFGGEHGLVFQGFGSVAEKLNGRSSMSWWFYVLRADGEIDCEKDL